MSKPVGFSGVFEAEFIETGNEAVLIDFNPRFYNQMAFDIARGLPLPLLAYYEAIGDTGRFDALCESTGGPPPPRGRVFVDLISLRVLLSMQRLSGALSRLEERNWRRWHGLHGDRCTDAAHDPADWLPGVMDAARNVYGYLRHPRAFVRTIVLNSATAPPARRTAA